VFAVVPNVLKGEMPAIAGGGKQYNFNILITISVSPER